MVKIFSIRENKKVIYNGVDVNKDKKFKKKYREKVLPLIFCQSVGFVYAKNYQTIIMALNLLPKSKLKYRIIGQEPIRENLVNLVKKNNLKMLNFMNGQMICLYITLKVIFSLFPSKNEGFGLVAIEAFSFGSLL